MKNEIKSTNENINDTKLESILITDSNFALEVLQSDKTVIVHFSLESEYDIKIEPTLTELVIQYSSVKLCKIKMKEQPIMPSKYGVFLAPTLLIFSFGKVVAQIVGAAPKESINLKLDAIIGKPSDELTELTLPELIKAYKKSYKQDDGEWNQAVFSGLVAGIIFAIVRSNFQSAASLIVPGLAIAFFIQNKNFGFSWLQKALAMVIMLLIGVFNKEIVELIRQWFFAK